jgi:hypothetical protein
MAEKIARVEAEDQTAFEYVADSPAGPGSVLAWLMEAGGAGDFNQAVEAFARASEIVHRLACISSSSLRLHFRGKALAMKN